VRNKCKEPVETGMSGVMNSNAGCSRIVCADVDGTVLATDLLYESLIFAVKRDVSVLFRIPFWLMQGRAVLKRRLAERSAELDLGLLPVNPSVVAYLESAAAEGARIVLASASDRSLVKRLAERFSFVSEVIASDGAVNCKGSSKASLIEATFPGQEFDYIGDSRADRAVWRRAKSVVCVSRSSTFSASIKREFSQAVILAPAAQGGLGVYLRALRVHQWAKNILVFLPLLLAHQWSDGGVWLKAVCAAVAMSLCASGVYVLNDLLDLESDRGHLRKKKRVFASGEVGILTGLAAIPVLFVSAFGVCALVNSQSSIILLLYLLLTTAYSYRLKAIALVDIVLLAILYSVRIIMGGVAAGIVVSQWLICLSMFLFLSLACVKRFSELLLMQAQGQERTAGRGYSVGDSEQIASFGSASGYIAALVMALYVSSREIAILYAHPTVVWLACPLLLYWISRIWLLARRGLIHDDPVIFALGDRVTYVVCFLGALIFFGAK
jgi:4-hydroxybenzoate polyprenyltransferase